jgi:HEAT repeat protein
LVIEATKALGQIGDTRAVEPLIAALPTKSAAEALNQLGWEPGRDEVGARYWMAKGDWEKCVAIGAPAVEPLIGELQYGGWQAAEVLGQIGDTRAVEPLIAALKDEDSFVRWQAAEALGQIGDTRAVEPLIAALKDESKQVRGPAAEALRRIGDARTVESLIAALKDESKQVRGPAAEVLGQIGNPRAVEPLIEALKDDDNNDVRIAAARALVALYTSGSLDDAHKQTILSFRDTITSTGRHHYDDHTDYKRPGACYDMHDDRPAIWVDFPL